MNLPSGLIFYLDFQYGQDQPGFTSGNSLYAESADQKKTELPSLSKTKQGLYGAGRFGYSINEQTVICTSPVSGAATMAGILNFDGEFSSSVSTAGETFGAANGTGDDYYTVSVLVSDLTGSGAGATADLDGIRAFTVTSGVAGEIEGVYPEFTRLTTNNTKVEFLVSGAAKAAPQATCSFQLGPDNLDDRGDFEDTVANGAGLTDNAVSNSIFKVASIIEIIWT
jgi:hypothetical protein